MPQGRNRRQPISRGRSTAPSAAGFPKHSLADLCHLEVWPGQPEDEYSALFNGGGRSVRINT
jgi:hypothetical protein